MKKFFLTISAVLFCLLGFSANPDGKIKINIILAEQPDSQQLIRMANAFPTKAERRNFVVISTLPEGIYFITIGNSTLKFLRLTTKY